MVVHPADFYDAELRRHNVHLHAAAGAQAHDRVLDFGRGAGQTTREVARAAVKGTVLGIDISAPMLEVARLRTNEERLWNVAFEQGDAQSHGFLTASFDLCISRFGVMFFADPAAAFANIGRAMRPGARLVWMVWQSHHRNPWSTAIRQALAPESAIPPAATGAFSLGDPVVTRDLLQGAGFTSVDFTAVCEPVCYGADVETAYQALVDLQFVGTRTVTKAAERQLRELLQAHLTPDGVLFDSRAWIITARRGPTSGPPGRV